MKNKFSKNKSSVNSEVRKNRSDGLFWAISVVVVIVAIVLDRLYGSNIMWAIRLAAWIVISAFIVFLLSFTLFGKKSWKFFCDSRMEMRKVVWTKREETVRTTLVVSGLTILTALILWGADSILLFIIGWLTGQRG